MAQYRWVIILTLAVLAVGGFGIWYGQLAVNEGAMRAAMLRDDAAAISSLLDKWPCPVNAVFRGRFVDDPYHGNGIHSGRSSRYDNDEITPLLWSLINSHTAVFRKCLDKGAGVRRHYGYLRATALHCAAWRGTPEMVDALLVHGADARAEMADGEQPLHCAGNPETVRIFVKHGADVNARDKEGATPLRRMAPRNAPVVAALLDCGADVNAKDNRGETPLDAAVDCSWDTVKLLISRGADVNTKGLKGWTPLHRAACLGATVTVEALLAAGADANAKTDDGLTPLAAARKFRTQDKDRTPLVDACIVLLLKSGAKE